MKLTAVSLLIALSFSICATNASSQNQPTGDLIYKEFLEHINHAAKLQDDDGRKLIALRQSYNKKGFAKQEGQYGNENDGVVATESNSKNFKHAKELLEQIVMKQIVMKQQENIHEENKDALVNTEEESNLITSTRVKDLAKTEHQGHNTKLQRCWLKSQTMAIKMTNTKATTTNRWSKKRRCNWSDRRRGGQVRGGKRRRSREVEDEEVKCREVEDDKVKYGKGKE